MRELTTRFPHHRELICAYHHFWEDSIAGPIEETVRIVERLRAAGYRLVGLSNWSTEKFRLTRERYGLFKLFDEIVISGDVQMMKPEPEIFQLTLRKLNLRADECLFIDDSKRNVDAAARVGFQVIHFQSPAQLQEELKRAGI